MQYTIRAAELARSRAYWLVIALLLLPVGVETALQAREDAFIRETALRVVREAHAVTPRERVIALRDFVRRSVTAHGAPGTEDRPFLRATAEDTLRSGLGYGGEGSRVFVNLARAIGIEAQRVNLYGFTTHVVAEVELEPRQRLIVDAQSPPMIDELEPLDQVILRPEFDDFYTVNLRRLHLGWLVSRLHLEMGPHTYWVENPHALSAASWACAIVVLLMLRVGRDVVRGVLHRRGWVHRSALDAADDLSPPRARRARPGATSSA